MTDDKEKSFAFRVENNSDSLRTDVFLAEKDILLTRSQIKRIITEGHVLVNEVPVKPGYRVKVGDIVVLKQQEPKTSELVAEDIPLTIAYEDESLLVIDKHAGMVVHPAAGNYRGTLVNALLFHCNDLSGIGGVLRPGIVHRLDKYTSGLMVVAKSDRVHGDLAAQFKMHRVKKMYKVLVHGDVKDVAGVIALPIGRHPHDRKKMSTSSKRGKMSVTEWKVVDRFGCATLLDVTIKTGRTHQIRVHLNSRGHPVVGDNVYGNSKKRGKAIQDDGQRYAIGMMKRQALHSSRIGFSHPVENRYMEFSSPLPDDMASVCKNLREYRHSRTH